MKKIKDIIYENKNVIYYISWVIFILYACLMIWEIFVGPYRSYSGVRRYNLYPFKTIINYIINNSQFTFHIVFINLIANIITFIPLGFFIPLLFKRLYKFKNFFEFSAILIIGIEAMQLVLNVGIFDVDDIILNLIGCILGFFLFGIVRSYFVS